MTLPFNILATIRFNFHYFPFRQAIKIPVVLYHNIKFVRLTGSLSINSPIHFKMVQIGTHGYDMFPNRVTTIDIAGALIFSGDQIRVGHGSLLRVEPGAELVFNKNTILGANNTIFCSKKIEFEENSLFSWDCQIMDSDTHHLKDIETGNLSECTKPILIGCDSWVGNHVIINKGTVIPQGTIVSSFSLCNKDYTDMGNNNVLGGVPAKLISKNKIRVD